MKRILSSILALCLLASLACGMVFAAGTQPEAEGVYNVQTYLGNAAFTVYRANTAVNKSANSYVDLNGAAMTNFYPQADNVVIKLSGVTEGKYYLALATSTELKAPPTKSDDILYLDQQTAGDSVSFKVYPAQLEAGTTYYVYLISNAGDLTKLTKAASFSYFAQVIVTAPTGITTANNLTTGRVKLSWTAVKGAVSYNIYRSATEKGTYTKLNDKPVTALTYTDGKSGNAGNTYWYKLTAVNGAGESEQSAAVSQVSMCQRPTNLKATANDAAGTVTLTWDAPTIKSSVSGYRIYKWNTAKKAFEWIGGSLKAAGTATTFTIPAEYVTRGEKTQYSIRGFNTKNTLKSISIYSLPATVTVAAIPAAPTGITPANNLTTGRVKLSWKAVANATGYNIYRAATEKGTYTKLNDSPVTALTYTDGKSGNSGNTYWYKITAVNGAGESKQSAAVSQVSMCQRPTDLKATANKDGSVTLTWSAPAIKSSVSGYRIYLWDKSANGGKGAFQWINGSLKAGAVTTVQIPASALTAYKGQSVQFSIRGFNTKNTLKSLSIYAVPAAATVK